MAASSADLLTLVGSPGTATTLAAPGFTIGNTSINVGNTANWPTATGAVFAIDQVTTQIINGVSTQVRIAGTYCEFEGTVVSSTQITNLVLKQGTSQNYPAGSNTRVYIPVASTRENNIVTWGTNQHKQDGTHGAVTATSLSVSGATALIGALTLNLWDGWIMSPDTWAYVSATSFKIAGVDRTAQFPVGAKIKLTQTTAKYFYVAAASFSTDTTITVTGGSDYTLANAAITSPGYSYGASPQGFPQWFNYAPTLTGFSANPTNGVYRFNVVGRQCTIDFTNSSAGTSNSVNFTATAPITSANQVNAYWGTVNWFSADNGVALSTPGRAWIQGNTTTITIGKTTAADGNWTATGSKQASFTLTYEI